MMGGRKSLCVICEGVSEEKFVHNVLALYLYGLGWTLVESVKLPTGINRAGGTAKGGGFNGPTGYQWLLKHMRWMILEKRHSTDVFTTMFDFYKFPPDIPCRDEAEHLSDSYARVQLYENQLKGDIISCMGNYNLTFVPYVQLHEYEALLFADIDIVVETWRERLRKDHDDQWAGKHKTAMNLMLNQFANPELINHESAPSKRIEQILPEYRKNDTAGLIGFNWEPLRRVGIEKLKERCRHFSEWIGRLEALALHSDESGDKS